jgi:hypothetical protein
MPNPSPHCTRLCAVSNDWECRPQDHLKICDDPSSLVPVSVKTNDNHLSTVSPSKFPFFSSLIRHRTCIFCNSTHSNSQALTKHLIKTHEKDDKITIHITDSMYFAQCYLCIYIETVITTFPDDSGLFSCISKACDYYGTILMLHEHLRGHERDVRAGFFFFF